MMIRRSIFRTVVTAIPTSSGRVSVETVVGLSIAGLTLLVFGMVFVANGQREQSSAESGSLRGVDYQYRALPHGAVAFDSDLANSPSSPRRADDRTGISATTQIRDGVTIVTPPLLVPVINLNSSSTLASKNTDNDRGSSDSSKRQSVTSRKQFHRSSAARTNRHSRRNTVYRIVGLAANRRVVVAER